MSPWLTVSKEPELWRPQGDCVVHLYGRSESKSGAVFKMYYKTLYDARCYYLLDKYLVRRFSEPDYGSRPNICARYELYIPAPGKKDPIQSFKHHLAMRNFFAWVHDRSLVGLPNLGGALVALLNSMEAFRSKTDDNVADIREYMEREGYSDMSNHPDHALAILFFAEHFRFKDLWLNAFAHCVGMYDRLHSSPEFEVSQNCLS